MTPSKKSNTKPQLIIIIGPPGAGKGTQAELLSEKLSLYHWETSRIVGNMISSAKKGSFVIINRKRYYFEEERKLRESGKLWSPPFVSHLMEKKLIELAKEGKGIALSGSPRTLYEAETITPLLKKLYGARNIKLLLIKIKPKDSIWRNLHRRECSLIHHSILFSKETAKLTKCPLDGSKIVKRKDDKVEVIKVRLEQYKKRTEPVIGSLEKQKIKIIKINGSPTPAIVFKNILKALK